MSRSLAAFFDIHDYVNIPAKTSVAFKVRCHTAESGKEENKVLVMGGGGAGRKDMTCSPETPQKAVPGSSAEVRALPVSSAFVFSDQGTFSTPQREAFSPSFYKLELAPAHTRNEQKQQNWDLN